MKCEIYKRLKKVKKKPIIVILIALITVSAVVFHFSVLMNEKALFLIAEGLDKPSSLYNIVIKRIYYLYEKDDLSEKIKNHLEQDRNVQLNNLYIQVLGIGGASSSAAIFIKEYSRWQHDTNHLSTINRIVDAMGLIANDDLIPFLETLLQDHDKLNVQATKYSIVRSLYLLTGKKYTYINYSGRKTELQVTEELTEARSVIVNSKGRKRSLEEMLLLDRLYRPPGI
jgi:hypothetical protein